MEKKRYTAARSNICMGLLLLFQFLAFPGFSDCAPERSTSVQSEWVAAFPAGALKSVSYRRARAFLIRYGVDSVRPAWVRGREDDRYAIRQAGYTGMHPPRPLCRIPTAAWPRHGLETDRS